MRNSWLPVGMLVQEASEARNKNYKQYIRDLTRKHSRLITLTDLFYRVMDSSNPKISTASFNSWRQKNKHLLLPEEVQKLLLPISSEAAVTSDVEDVEGMEGDEAE